MIDESIMEKERGMLELAEFDYATAMELSDHRHRIRRFRPHPLSQD